MKNKLTALVEVRKIIALVTIILFFVLSVMDLLETNFIQTVIISIVSFYFGKTASINEKGDK
ncbi:MAG: hypothetical protein RR588_15795 [Solibacillus sp.]